MKPFDIELAKQGYPVCTRDGRPARIICFDRKSKKYPVLALVEKESIELPCCYSEKGKYDNVESIYDLFMSPEKKEGWINIYNRLDGKVTGHCIYSSEEEARKNILGSKDVHLATIKIEWEE